MPSLMTSIGTAVPAYAQEQSTLIDFMTRTLSLTEHNQKRLHSLYLKTSIQSRHTVIEDINAFDIEMSTKDRMKLYEKHAFPLAKAAIDNCLSAHPELNIQDITHLITVSCTGMYAPGLEMDIIQGFGLKKSIHRLAVNYMGCYAVIPALKIAKAICSENLQAKVLIVSVELCSLHFRKSNKVQDLIASAIFSDGAGAVLVESEHTQPKGFMLSDFNAEILPESMQEMRWDIGNEGFEIVLTPEIPHAIKKYLPNLFIKLLEKNSFSKEDVKYFSIHPGGIKILRACEAALDISKEDNRYGHTILEKYGNMSSSTLLFLLKMIFDEIQVDDHQKKIFGCAFGPGLVAECMLLDIYHV